MADFVEYKNKGIWQHFLREKGGQSAQSELCKTELKSVGGSTKGLHEHTMTTFETWPAYDI